MKRIFDYQIERETTIRNYLDYLGVSRDIISMLKKLPNDILVNGIHQNVDRRLKRGDTLSLVLIEEEHGIIPSDISLEIVYEDEDILIINKPHGMPVHPSRFHPQDSLANALVYRYKDEGFVFHCINILDSDTSGLVLIGKNRLMASWLNRTKINKSYQAIVEGKMAESVVIDGPIARVDASMKREVSVDGDKATTYCSLIEYIKEKDCSLIRCTLHHGRTHQIRVHCSHIGHPLIGDRLYNEKNTQMPRQALHCDTLSFIHPITKKELHFYIDLPTDMKSFLSR